MDDIDIFSAICREYFEEVKRIVKENPEIVHIKDSNGWTPLDKAIAWGKLEIAKFLFEKGGRSDFDCDGRKRNTPVHHAAHRGFTTTLKWGFKNIFRLPVLKIKTRDGRTPLDEAIAGGKLETVKFLWGKGGRPNLEIYYRNGKRTPVHWAANSGHAATLKWVFENKILPLRVLKIKSKRKRTPLDGAIRHKHFETASLLMNHLIWR